MADGNGGGFGCGIAGLVLTAVAAAVVVPNLMRKGCGGNRTAAIATLRNLGHVQEEFRSRLLVDLDGDGRGEFGTFGEMTGYGGLRRDPAAVKRGAPASPPLLSPALVPLAEARGLAMKSGYAFGILLPGAGGYPVREGGTGAAREPAFAGRRIPVPASALSGPVDTDRAEAAWAAYAWPVAAGNSGTVVFFTDDSGEIWETANEDGRYSGSDRGPSWDAAMPEDGWGATWASPPEDAGEYRGRDGNTWRRLR
jgi:hypothetical protein